MHVNRQDRQYIIPLYRKNGQKQCRISLFQKAYLKNAEDNDRQAGAAQLGDARQELRRSAEGHRKEAAAICQAEEPQRTAATIVSMLPGEPRHPIELT